MYKQDLLGVIEYRADVAYDPSATYEFEFLRPGEHYFSYTSIPSKPHITFPANGSVIAKDNALTITWDAVAGTSTSIDLSYSQNQTHEGMVRVKTGTITKHQSPEIGSVSITPSFEFGVGDAQGSVSITRFINGNHDSILKGTTRGVHNSKVNFIFQ